MRITSVTIALGLLLVIAPIPLISQTLHIVQVSNYAFTPSDLTVTVGDTVRWENKGGLHSVVADDGSFTSGAPSSSAWTYDKVFTTIGNYQYYCAIHGAPGGVGMSGIIRVINAPTGVTDNKYQPDRFILEQNFPNPFNPSTKIRYTLPQQSLVSVKVFNVLGMEIMTLMNGEESAGHHEIIFDATNMPSGLYLYRVQAGKFDQTKKMLLLK